MDQHGAARLRDREPKTPPMTAGPNREAALAAALRANLKRRKAPAPAQPPAGQAPEQGPADPASAVDADAQGSRSS